MKHALLLLLVGCPETRSAPPQEDAVPPPPQNVEPKKRSARVGTYPVRDLAKEAARGELRTSGLVINLGTPDQHKYVPAFWILGESKKCDDVPCTTINIRATLGFYDWQRFERVAIRVRSKSKRQKLELKLDGTRLGKLPVGRKWRVLNFPVKKVKPGLHSLVIDPTKKGLDVDWVWMTSSEKSEPGDQVKVKTLSYGDGLPRESLVADPPRNVSYYIEVPKDAKLVFDYGALGQASFSVYAHVDGAGRERLFSGEAGKGWEEGVVDLSALAGETVRLDLSTKGKAKSAGWGDARIVVPGRRPEPIIVGASKRAKSVIHLTIDTVRADVFSVFNPKTRVKTPAFEKLAADSTIFENAYTTGPWTKPSVASLLSGLYSGTHGAYTEEAMMNGDVLMLQEHLKSHGFTTACFSANGYISDRFAFDVGWSHYVNFAREKLRTQGENVFETVAEWLEKQDPTERFFLYIQTVDPHVPYQAPGKYYRMYGKSYDGVLGDSVSGYEHDDFNDGKLELSGEDREYMLAQYHGEISYHDHYMGKFIERLEEMGLLEDTVVIVTNDHGEELFERGKVGHGQSLYDELIKNPMLIRYPKVFPKGQRVKHGVSLVDVAPTVLELLGVAPMPEIEGLSVTGAVANRPGLVPSYTISERKDIARTVRAGRYKMIVSKEEADRLFDMELDPLEKKNLARSHPIAHRATDIYLREGLAIRKKAERLTGMTQSKTYKAPKAKIDPELLEELRALGYFND